jgi:hypothetical protein
MNPRYRDRRPRQPLTTITRIALCAVAPAVLAVFWAMRLHSAKGLSILMIPWGIVLVAAVTYFIVRRRSTH